jgi:hypothetical protein
VVDGGLTSSSSARFWFSLASRWAIMSLVRSFWGKISAGNENLDLGSKSILNIKL